MKGVLALTCQQLMPLSFHLDPNVAGLVGWTINQFSGREERNNHPNPRVRGKEKKPSMTRGKGCQKAKGDAEIIREGLLSQAKMV